MKKHDQAMVQAAARRLAASANVPVEVVLESLMQMAAGIAPNPELHHHRWPLTTLDVDCLLAHDTLV